MKFYPPSWLTPIPQDLSGLGSIGDFVLRGQHDAAVSDPAILISADDEKDVKTPQQLAEDVENLAAALAQDLEWAAPASVSADGGRVIALLSENTVRKKTPPEEEEKALCSQSFPRGERKRANDRGKRGNSLTISPAPGQFTDSKGRASCSTEAVLPPKMASI